MSKAYARELVKVAKNEVGYLEKKSAKNEESKTANAGSNNYTKYGKWLSCDGAYWCASFVSWCFMSAFGSDKGKSLLGGYSASCEVIRNAMAGKGAYHARGKHTPEAGDVIFFSGTRHSGANHIGIVTKCADGKVYTVEGNTSGGSSVIDNGGGVAAKSYALTNSRILGYGCPDYDNKEFDTMDMPSIKYASTGAHVKTLQAVLKSKYSRDLSVDGDFGTNTTKQLKAVQKQLGLSQDGICGSKTWAAIL